MKWNDWFEWLKDKLLSGTSRKHTMTLVILFFVGVAFLIVSSFFRTLNEGKVSEERTLVNEQNVQEGTSYQKDDYVKDMEQELSGILSRIDNAGKVSVMITLNGSKESVPAKDENISDRVTNEKDTDGGTRVINESNTNDKVVFVNGQGGNSKPLIVKEKNPEIKGVIVVAEGARDSRIKRQISQAVQTVLDIPAYRVIVYSGSGYSVN